MKEETLIRKIIIQYFNYYEILKKESLNFVIIIIKYYRKKINDNI